MVEFKVSYMTINVAAGASAAQSIGPTKTIVGLITPASAASTTMTFQASDAIDGTYRELNDINGDPIQIAGITTTSEHRSLDPSVFAGVSFVKLVPGTTESPARDYILVLRDIT
jgi:hypothetical protein